MTAPDRLMPRKHYYQIKFLGGPWCGRTETRNELPCALKVAIMPKNRNPSQYTKLEEGVYALKFHRDGRIIYLYEGRSFYIVNHFDRPCEDLIAELIDGEHLKYIAPTHADWPVMAFDEKEATPIWRFGIDIEIIEETLVNDGMLIGEWNGSASTAQYHDGRPRKWQGLLRFKIPLTPN